MSEITREQAVAKVQKLRRLARSDNKNEAALAWARATEIMEKYHLAEADVVEVEHKTLPSKPDDVRGFDEWWAFWHRDGKSPPAETKAQPGPPPLRHLSLDDVVNGTLDEFFGDFERAKAKNRAKADRVREMFRKRRGR